MNKMLVLQHLDMHSQLKNGSGIWNKRTRNFKFNNSNSREAYYDSIPSLFITAHSLSDTDDRMRTIEDQEINVIPIFSSITKYCVRVDNINNFYSELIKCVSIANSGRKGPVVIDISSKIWNSEVFEK